MHLSRPKELQMLIYQKRHQVLEYLSGSGGIHGEHGQSTFQDGTPLQTDCSVVERAGWGGGRLGQMNGGYR